MPKLPKSRLGLYSRGRLGVWCLPMSDVPHRGRLSVAFRRAYEGAGLSQQALGEILGIDQSLISKYARGAVEPPLELLPSVDQACGQPLGYVLRLAGFVSDEVGLETAIDADPDLDAADKGAMHLMLKTLRGRTSGGRSDPDSRPTAGELRQRLDRVTGRGADHRERPA